ncbi:regulation of adaxial/abaxial pattern formation [Mactra antiquata]
MNRTTKIKITELNPHVICVLCGGYYINATTITECLHSFCRTCITRYLETSKYCPVCDVMVHKTRPLDYIRSDKTLQDLVYKLVPGLYKNEMKRRREYYHVVDPPGVSQPPSEDRGDEFHDRIIYTEDEKISLSLELCAEGIPFKTPTNVHGHTGPENIRIKDIRYLQCPAAFSIGNIKKFIRMKFDIKQKFEIDIFHTAEPLPDYYSLMDIAYIYTWTRRAPLRLYYTVFERKPQPKAPDPVHAVESKNVKNNLIKKIHKKRVANKVKALNKKRKLLDGPDDISPDLAFDRVRPCKRKAIGTPKKRARRINDEVDDSVKEAMSESEEQLAKLTLDCSTEGGIDSNNIDSNDNISEATTECGDVHNLVTDDESLNTECVKANPQDVVTTETKALEILTDIAASKLRSESNTISGDNTVAQSSEDKLSDVSSKHSSAQVSPGSGSIKLSLFQPLNSSDEHIVVPSPVSDVDKLDKEANSKLYDFCVEETVPVPVKRPRGRPKLNKNKPPVDKLPKVKKKINSTTECKENDDVSLQNDSTVLKPVKSAKKKTGIEGVDAKQKRVRKADKISDSPSKTDSDKSKSGERVKRKYVRKQKVNDQNNVNGTDYVVNRSDKSEVILNGTETLTDVKAHSVEIDKDNNIGVHSQSVLEGINVNNDSQDSVGNKSDAIQTLQKSTDVKDQDKQVMVNSTSLQEPVTPLYGETPKMNESNQGLPCSPNMDSLDNSGRLVIDIGVNSEDTANDNPKENGDKLDPDVDQSNGAIDENNVKNMMSNCSFSKEIFRNSYGTSDVNHTNTTPPRNGSEIPHAHSDPFRHIMNGISPTNALNMLGGFSPPLSAHLHMGHMTVSPTSYQVHDLNFDQPLDLTNAGMRDEYTKGKIFKTKMVKKSFPKQDNAQHTKDKTQSSTFPH